jgi:hypothetical protein
LFLLWQKKDRERGVGIDQQKGWRFTPIKVMVEVLVVGKLRLYVSGWQILPIPHAH